MNKYRFLIFISCIFFTTISSAKSEKRSSYGVVKKGQVITKLDPKTSSVKWSGEMLGIYKHEGIIKFTSGSINWENDKISSGLFTIDMTTIQPTDDNFGDAEGSRKDDLVMHLSSNDFFGVEKHPVAKFEITSTTSSTIKGKMTIKGVTREETVTDVAILGSKGKKTITGNIKINRQNYGVNYQNATKDKIISNEIPLIISIIVSE